MHLCLINPPQPWLVNPGQQCALGMLYVAAAAEGAGHDVTVVEASRKPNVRAAYGMLPDADVYGFTATTADYVRSVEPMAAIMKASWPERPILLGGACYLGPELINYRLIDCLVIGEGEQAIVHLLGELERGQTLPPHYLPTPVDVNDVAIPARRRWPEKLGGHVFAGDTTYYGGESTVITSSRGCPCKCAFCGNAAMGTRHPRYRKAGAVIEEMEKVVKDHDIRQFRFSDENLTANRDHLSALCEGIRKSSVLSDGCAWRASIRAVPNDTEMFEDMRSAGCREISVGVENADPQVLDRVRKGLTIEDSTTCLDNAREAGLVTRALLMCGLPGERPETLKLNLKWMLEAHYDIISLTIFVPWPGCDIREHPGRYGCHIRERDVRDYNQYFFDADGPRDVEPYIELEDFDWSHFTNNVHAMRRAAYGLGKLNTG